MARICGEAIQTTLRHNPMLPISTEPEHHGSFRRKSCRRFGIVNCLRFVLRSTNMITGIRLEMIGKHCIE